MSRNQHHITAGTATTHTNRCNCARIESEARSAPAEALAVLDSLESWARSHYSVKAGRGNLDDIRGFIDWYRARLRSPESDR